AGLEGLAAGAMAAVPSFAPLRVRLEGLCGFLRDGCGFGGDAEHYYEPDNSLIDRVLTTRRGIPISLAVVYVEVAARVGLDCEGVNFPGHFLVRAFGDEETLLVDPFAGTVLDDAACLHLLRSTRGPDAELREEHFAAASPLVVLVRMLNNLKQLAVAQERWFDALRFSELILLAEPGLVFEHGERAALFERIGQPDLALLELQQLEAAVDDATLRARVGREISRLTRLGGGDRTVH
ncbi:MAG: transglutaminase-like domain-containing protein, partial [Pseudomonadales bacterium]|nr:transglutaminase-like domain-containing protein [Pseudomonadales bacterium]